MTPHAKKFLAKIFAWGVWGKNEERALSGFSKLRFENPSCATTKKGSGKLPVWISKQRLQGVRPLEPREGFVPAGIVCHANKGTKMYRTNQQSARLNLD